MPKIEKDTFKLGSSLILIDLDDQIWYFTHPTIITELNFQFTAAVVSTSGEEDQELEKGNLEFTWKDAWLFLFPAVCDVTATSGPIFLWNWLTSLTQIWILIQAGQ